MTPQERQRVAELFDRLAQLESTPRDADAERAITDGLARAPHAIYPLVQTVLVQDEALRRADVRIRELEGTADEQGGGFLGSMRDALFGGERAPTSVPSVRQNAAGDQRWNAGTQQGAQAAGRGGSFLGTAAASAVGVIGGMMMANMIGSLLGQSSSGQAFASPASAERAPWDQQSGNSELARDAGLGDIAGGRGVADESRHASLFGSDDSAGLDEDFGGDFGGDFGAD